MDLTASVQSVKGIGPRRATALKQDGIETVGELLLHLPLRYEDRREVTPIGSLAAGTKACVRGVVAVVALRRARRMTLLECLIDDPTGRVRAVWFNQPYLRERLERGTHVVLYGAVTVDPRARAHFTLQSPQLEVEEAVEGEDDSTGDAAAATGTDTGRVVAIYERVGGLGPTMLRRLLTPLAAALRDDLPDPLPPALRERLGVIGLGRAVREVHAPPDGIDAATLEAYDAARSPAHLRLILEELFLFQLRLALRRRSRGIADGTAFRIDDGVRAACRRVLPFRLTAAQKRAAKEIADDLRAASPMRRLLQGDVGSGKTAVALLAMTIVAENGAQAAFLAPTEILAEQHFLTLKRHLAGSPYALELLTASVAGEARQAAQARIASGAAQIVVGTHALLEPAVRFARLGLAVIDEQHRFGVLQRQELIRKGPSVDALVMTATPIPRTLALTAYGDLDVSVLDELPPGRGTIETLRRTSATRREVVELVGHELRAGHQAYVVYPIIEEGEGASPLRAATTAYEEWQRALPWARIGLLHGRLTSDAKEAAMAAFARGQLQVLVATTVIEVGIDVANATLMIVEHAERFGLAQLHQLRGRVGRGSAPSTCVLLSHGRLTPEAEARLAAMVETRDGFVIAERDLAIRGPGELFGTRQAGLPRFRIADLVRDRELLERARAEARRYVDEDGAAAEALWSSGPAWERRFARAEVG